jgi:hypothetical protein
VGEAAGGEVVADGAGRAVGGGRHGVQQEPRCAQQRPRGEERGTISSSFLEARQAAGWV